MTKDTFDYVVPAYVEAAIEKVGKELDRIMWNIHQEEYDNPLRNNGNVEGFVSELFEIHAYDWVNDDQQYNFIYKGFEEPYKICWYKYFGRSMSANRNVTPDESAQMLDSMLMSLFNYERENDPDSGLEF